MSTPAVTVTSTTAVCRAAELFAYYGFSAMPVVDHAGELIGVVSEADLIRNDFAAPESPLGGGAGSASDRPAHTVGQVMASPPIAVDQDASLATIADIVISGRRRSIPVVDGRRVVGVITRHDLLPYGAHVNHYPAPVNNQADRSEVLAGAVAFPGVHRFPAEP